MFMEPPEEPPHRWDDPPGPSKRSQDFEDEHGNNKKARTLESDTDIRFTMNRVGPLRWQSEDELYQVGMYNEFLASIGHRPVYRPTIQNPTDRERSEGAGGMYQLDRPMNSLSRDHFGMSASYHGMPRGRHGMRGDWDRNHRWDRSRWQPDEPGVMFKDQDSRWNGVSFQPNDMFKYVTDLAKQFRDFRGGGGAGGVF